MRDESTYPFQPFGQAPSCEAQPGSRGFGERCSGPDLGRLWVRPCPSGGSSWASPKTLDPWTGRAGSRGRTASCLLGCRGTIDLKYNIHDHSIYKLQCSCSCREYSMQMFAVFLRLGRFLSKLRALHTTTSSICPPFTTNSTMRVQFVGLIEWGTCNLQQHCTRFQFLRNVISCLEKVS